MRTQKRFSVVVLSARWVPSKWPARTARQDLSPIVPALEAAPDGCLWPAFGVITGLDEFGNLALPFDEVEGSFRRERGRGRTHLTRLEADCKEFEKRPCGFAYQHSQTFLRNVRNMSDLHSPIRVTWVGSRQTFKVVCFHRLASCSFIAVWNA